MQYSSYKDLVPIDENRQKYLSMAKKYCQIVIRSKVRLRSLNEIPFLPFKSLIERHLQSKIDLNSSKIKVYLNIAEELKGVV